MGTQLCTLRLSKVGFFVEWAAAFTCEKSQATTMRLSAFGVAPARSFSRVPSLPFDRTQLNNDQDVTDRSLPWSVVAMCLRGLRGNSLSSLRNYDEQLASLPALFLSVMYFASSRQGLGFLVPSSAGIIKL